MNRENPVVLNITSEKIWLIEGKKLANNKTSHTVDESTSISRVANK